MNGISWKAGTSLTGLSLALCGGCAFARGIDPVLGTPAELAPVQAAVHADTTGPAPVGVDDIVVTAQRRVERSQDVPISVTAFSNERLKEQNITTAQNLTALVPSLLVSANGQASREVQGFTLRGVAPTYQGGSAVVVYLNEVPLPEGFSTSQQGGPGNYIDLENIQVLAGPQGTLFGRNTLAGAVLLVPRKPTDRFEGYVEGSIGNYEYRGLEGVINVPLVPDKLLVRVAGTYQDRTGYTRDVLWNKDRDDLHYYAGRIGITFRPVEGFENYLLAYGAHSRNNGTAWIAQSIFRTGPIYDRQADLARQLGPRQTRLSVDEFDQTKTWGLINKSILDLTDSVTLNNIVSYQSYWKNFQVDNDGTPLQLADLGSTFPNFAVPGLSDEFGIAPQGFSNGTPSGPRDNTRQFTEELQLQGSLLDKRLTFTAGGFYLSNVPKGEQRHRQVLGCAADLTGTCALTFQNYRVSTRSKAIYAQGTIDLGVFTPALNTLRITAGLRHTWDKIQASSNTYIPQSGGGVFCTVNRTFFADLNDCESRATLNSSASTWKFGVDYRPIPRLLLFATASRGYKAGGYNPNAVRPETRTWQPEKVISYEAGLKSDWHLGPVPLRLNISAYDIHYDPIQKGGIADVSPTGQVGSQKLPATVSIRGFDAEASIRPVKAIELGGNVGYTDGKYEKFTYLAVVPTRACNGLVPVGGTVDRSCEPYDAIKWTYSVYASVDLPVPESWGDLSLYANFAHVSTRVISLTEPGNILEPYGLLNLSLNWKNIGRSNFDANLFVTNATNKLYRTTASGLSSVGFAASIYGEPRMYGVRLRYHFGD